MYVCCDTQEVVPFYSKSNKKETRSQESRGAFLMIVSHPSPSKLPAHSAVVLWSSSGRHPPNPRGIGQGREHTREQERGRLRKSRGSIPSHLYPPFMLLSGLLPGSPWESGPLLRLFLLLSAAKSWRISLQLKRTAASHGLPQSLLRFLSTE